MQKIVIDTSTIIAVIAGESQRERIIQLTENKQLIAPYSLHWEIGNAFSSFFKRKRITLEQVIEAIYLYQQIPIEFVEPNLIDTLKIAMKFNIYAYDAYLLAAALTTKLPLLTLDKQLKELAKQLNIKVL